MLQWPSPTAPRRGALHACFSQIIFVALLQRVARAVLALCCTALWRPWGGDAVAVLCLALSARVSQVEGVRIEDDLQLS
jgi:hypothetical protein